MQKAGDKVEALKRTKAMNKKLYRRIKVEKSSSNI